MAIQIPNPGTGNGATGDNEFVLWSKVKDNFSDQTNAASRLVGTVTGQVPLSNQVRAAMLTRIDGTSTASPNSYENGTAWYVNGSSGLEGTPQGFSSYRHIIESRDIGGRTYQRAYGWEFPGAAHRLLINDAWSEWQPLGWSKKNYNTTTAAGANAVIDVDGRIIRSTSSERYKDILSPLELDDARYADAMALKPIVYRSTADADNPAYHFYSFSAEELGTYDPAFTLWRETETVTDEDGNVTEQPLAERQAEGININALLAMGHAIAIKQDSLIKALEARIEILEAK